MRPFLFIIAILVLSAYGYSYNKINYMDPQPDANYVSNSNNVTLGFENRVNLNNTDIENSITITGSQSMNHEGTVNFCCDNKKIIFTPFVPFKEGETVTVKIKGMLLKTLYSDRSEFKYSFNTSLNKTEKIPADNPKLRNYFNRRPEFSSPLPPPQLTVTVNNNPAPGNLLLSPFSGATFLIITNNNGILSWYSAPQTGFGGDFKLQPNGNFTFYDGFLYEHFEMDRNYNIVDTFYCGNGYFADIHELRVLNNHAFLMAYDTQIVDMSHIVTGGNPNARVVGLIIQEIDENKNVVFQWRSWDHFQITDATHENLLAPEIDYVHGNAIEVENDNAILISSRHLDEITKIDLTTGDIIWRLGGRNNQFTFTNDTLRFSHQHSIRRTANGNITLFDNGNYHSPQFSRAVEYTLDEQNKTAALVWQYRNNPDIFGSWGGYVQRLDNGNTLISWGGANTTVTEVTPAGVKVFEASYPIGVYTYRAYKFDLSIPVSINSGNMNQPSSYSLKQNYPNPFNPFTVIKYDIPSASYVELAVYDITGRELKKLVSEYKQPGSYSATFDGSEYSSGLYFYRLKAGHFTATQKMILVK